MPPVCPTVLHADAKSVTAAERESKQLPFAQSESSSELATVADSLCAAKRSTEQAPNCSAEHAAVLAPVFSSVGVAHAAAVPAAVSAAHSVPCRVSHKPPQRSAV